MGKLVFVFALLFGVFWISFNGGMKSSVLGTETAGNVQSTFASVGKVSVVSPCSTNSDDNAQLCFTIRDNTSKVGFYLLPSTKSIKNKLKNVATISGTLVGVKGVWVQVGEPYFVVVTNVTVNSGQNGGKPTTPPTKTGPGGIVIPPL